MSPQPERLLALFDELVELAAGARAARLAALRAEDAVLADDVARMLAADDAGGVLDRGMAAVAATLASDLDPTLDAAGGTRGRRVGPFTLERLLGRGGMGEVWLAARDEGGFRQEVALKLLKRGMDSEDLLRRFVQERRILAGLSHPNIARFIDGGVGEDGAPWYAMEYVEGVPLTEHARGRALDVRARVDLVSSVAEAVAYAQNRLVVHRDLKPSNILVDSQGRVRLLDFGIAKLLDEAPDAGATATGVRAMSPAYAAPEQILDEPVSAATDVYALGVVLYELLTGSLPHDRGNATLETLAERVRGETPDRPSQRLRRSEATTTTTLGGDANTAQRFARAVAGELDTIVLAALRREPERRYASAAAFADDLRRWLDGRPVAAQADTAGYRMRKFVSRHRLAVGSASAVLLALVAGFGTALWQASVAREQAHRAEQQAAIATAVTGFLTQDVIAAANPFRNPLELGVAEALRRAEPGIDARFSGQPRVAGVVRRNLAQALDNAGDSVRALTAATQARIALESDSGDLDPEALEARLVEAALLLRTDRWDEAEALYLAVRPRLESPALASVRLRADVGLAALMVERRDEQRGVARLEALLPDIVAAFGTHSPPHLEALGYYLSGFVQIERWEPGLAVCREQDATARSLFGEQSPMRVWWLKCEAQLLRLLERHDDALRVGEEALALASTTLGADHLATDEVRLQVMIAAQVAGDTSRAVELGERVVALREARLGERTEKTWSGRVWLARAYQRQGRLAEARALLDRAANSAVATLGANHPNAIPYRQTLGMFLHQTGDLAGALVVRRDVFDRAVAALPEGHINIAKYAFDLGQTLAAAGEHAALGELLRTWMPRWEQQFGPQDDRVIEARAWQTAAAGSPDR